MAFRQIHRRYSGFTYCKNPKIGVPIEESVSTTQDLLHTNSLRRFYFNEIEYYDQRWFHNSRGVGLALGFFSCGAAIGIFNGEWVTVPCTERTRFIPFYRFLHKFMGGCLQYSFRRYEDEAISPFHTDCITARRIFQDLIRQANLPQGSEIRRLIVVDSPLDVWALSLRHCRIMYVTSGLIRLFGSHEAKIATTLGREVGHDLAGHLEEVVSKTMCSVSVAGTSLYLFSQSTYIRSKFLLLDKFMRLPLLPSVCFLGAMGLLCYIVTMKNHSKTEVEADYIGLMLASSAGYDPRKGITFLLHAADDENRELAQLRTLRLVRPQVVREALSRYRRATEPPDDNDSKDNN